METQSCPKCGQPRAWSGWRTCSCGYDFGPGMVPSSPSEESVAGRKRVDPLIAEIEQLSLDPKDKRFLLIHAARSPFPISAVFWVIVGSIYVFLSDGAAFDPGIMIRKVGYFWAGALVILCSLMVVLQWFQSRRQRRAVELLLACRHERRAENSAHD